MHSNTRIKAVANALLAHLQPRPRHLAGAFSHAAAGVLLVMGQAQAQAQEMEFNIAAQSLDSALREFSKQTDLQLLYNPDDVKGLDSEGVSGRMLPAAAVGHILQGTPLAHEISGNTITLRRSQGTLRKILVEDSADLGTEDTGSYTTKSMSTATRLNLSIRETPQSISVITRRQLDDQNLTSVSDALERSVGISLNQNETDRAQATARGFYLDGIQFDGIPTLPIGMQDDAMLSDTALYDRVEIVRGAPGLLTGVGNPGAAINVVRKRPTREFQGYLSTEAGRWDAYRAEGDISGPIAANGAIRGRLVGGWRDTDSHVDKYNNQRQLAYGIVEADVTESTLLTAGVDYQGSDSQGMTYGAPVPLFYSDGSRTHLPRSTTTGADWTFLNSDRITAFAGVEQHFSNNWLIKAQYHRRDIEAENQMAYLYGNPDRASGAGVGVFLNSYDHDATQDNVDVYLSGGFEWLGRQHELVLGWSYADQSSTHKYHPVVSSTPLTSFYDWPSHPEPVFGTGFGNRTQEDIRQDGLYTATRWQLADPLKLIVGARLSSVSYGYDQYQPTSAPSFTRAKYDNELTPYGGVVYDISEHYSAYASYTKIFKYQTNKDSSGSLLDAVTGANYEVGLKGEFNDGRLTVSTALFRIEQDNLAQFVGYVEGESRYRAIEGATARGYELEVSGEVLPGWNLSGGFTRRLAEDAQGNPVLTTEPQNLLRLTSSYRFSRRLQGLMLGGHVSYQSEMIYLNGGPGGADAVQGAYSLLDLFGSYAIGERLRVQANINNLLDKVYYKSVASYGYYGEPRNVTVTARYSF